MECFGFLLIPNMPLPSNHTDFKLPGLAANPDAITSLIVAFVFAYSRRANRRRLEDHFHGFWNLVLGHLVYGSPYLILAPQMSIYYRNEDNLPPHPEISFQTTAGKEEERRPDFTIMGVRISSIASSKSSPSTPGFGKEFKNWNEMVFNSATPRILVELKRPPSRHLDSQASFEEALEYQFFYASLSAYEQAVTAFNCDDFASMDSIILINAVGEWWRFRILTRDEVETANKAVPFFQELDEEQEQEKTKETKTKKKGSRNQAPKKPTAKKSQSLPPKRVPIKIFRNLNDLEPIYPDAEKCGPKKGYYTSNILFGSHQSNQCFHYIHSLLKRDESMPAKLDVSLFACLLFHLYLTGDLW